MADAEEDKSGRKMDADDTRYNLYPDAVSFTGVGHASLKSIHIIAISLVALGVLFAFFSSPGGYVLLAVFILIAAGYDMIFIRKSQKPVRVTLHLRRNPVEATMKDGKPIGEIAAGAIQTEMEKPNELGYRPALNKDLLVWVFDSESDAKIAARRLLEYVPKDTL
jgi:hypothetical protein